MSKKMAASPGRQLTDNQPHENARYHQLDSWRRINNKSYIAEMFALKLSQKEKRHIVESNLAGKLYS